MNEITKRTIEDYKNYLVEEEKCSVTIEKYIRDINAFAEWLDGREITKTLVLEYKSMLTQQYAPASVNSVLSSLNGYFNYIERYDLKVKNLKVQRQIFCQSEKELTKAEYERLLKAAKSKKNERLYLIMQTICATGIRVSELKYVDVNSVMTGQAQVRLKGKIRMVILPRELCALLKKYIKEKHITSGSVFVTRKGQPVDRHSIWKSMKQLCETAGVSKDKVFPHNLRHTFATTSVANGMDIKTLSTILGHVSSKTTLDIYLHSTEEMKKEAAEKINARFSKDTDVNEETITDKQEKPPQAKFEPKKGKMRKPGTGCISKINDHLYEGRYSPKDAYGKRMARNIYAPTREECEEKLAILIKGMKTEIAEQKAKLKNAK